ncbi:antitoxin [Amycolatopsis sp. ATCC 39116]|uniref:antitoxin n=1 Tax=Amycolatopsis sp. (strain ATCC 39116 / 75iv2) TaxID=385957 RepID=UPI0002627D98|nr:antitoxin [Amycolatopsis sp. ATCC 39116]
MNMFDKAKDAMGKNPDKTDQGIDKAAEAAKGRFGEHADKIDQASQKAKDFARGQQEQPPPQ